LYSRDRPPPLSTPFPYTTLFRSVRERSDEDIARLARELEIDIAVDLKGFTEDARTGIFAFRAAPIQVSYLGYPGTLGAEFIDYLDRKSTRLNSSHVSISYAVFCL